MKPTSKSTNHYANYYEALEECYTDHERLGKPELADTNATQMRWTMMMMPWVMALLKPRNQVQAIA